MIKPEEVELDEYEKNEIYCFNVEGEEIKLEPIINRTTSCTITKPEIISFSLNLITKTKHLHYDNDYLMFEHDDVGHVNFAR